MRFPSLHPLLSRCTLAAALAWTPALLADEPAAAPAEPEDPAPVFTVPFADDIRIDGRGDDWRQVGVQQGRLQAARGNLQVPDEDFGADLSLAWNDRGLLVRVKVTDDAAAEVPQSNELYRHDSIELFMIQGDEKVQHVIAPGLADAVDESRHMGLDHRQDAELKRDQAVGIAYAVAKTEEGYLIEAQLPWDALGIKAAVGTQLRVQVMANDADAPTDSRLIYSWHPDPETYRDNRMSHRIRLVPTRHRLAGR